MSSTPMPPEEPLHDGPAATTPPATMPTSVRVAVVVMSVLAGLLLLYAALTWFNRDQVIDRLIEAGGLSKGQAQQVVLTSVIPFGVLGLVLASPAWFLARRQPWARWVGLAAVIVLALLTLASVLAERRSVDPLAPAGRAVPRGGHLPALPQHRRMGAAAPRPRVERARRIVAIRRAPASSRGSPERASSEDRDGRVLLQARVTRRPLSPSTPATSASGASTTTSSPSRMSPASSALASWSPIADCTSRRSGRAP